MPDLETFVKLCRWVERDPGEFLGFEKASGSAPDNGAQVHLRKRKTASKETAESLGALILAVQAAAEAHNRLLG